MANVKKFKADGSAAGTHEVPGAVFESRILVQAVQQALLRQLGNRRNANPTTLTKSEVSGTGKKPWKQKGTGRARQGSLRNPHFRKGGVAHGPDGRIYTTEMNKRTRRAALASILTDKVRKERLAVIEAPAFEAPKTRRVADLVAAMGMAGKKVLFVTHDRLDAFERSVRNLPRCKALLYRNLNPHDLMVADHVVLFDAAVDPLVGQLTRARKAGTTEEARS